MLATQLPLMVVGGDDGDDYGEDGDVDDGDDYVDDGDADDVTNWHISMCFNVLCPAQ